MKRFIMLLLLFPSTVFAEDIAIEAVMKHPKTIELLSTKPLTKYWVEFNQMELGGECGFTGCNWRKLVSIIVTSKGSNALSSTTIALVSGHKPNNINNITVEFVELIKLTKNTTQTKQQL